MILKTRWRLTATLTAWACISLSCAHAPDPHVHLSAPALPLSTRIIVQGTVTDSTTGNPVPYAGVYIVDARHENWEYLAEHSAFLGTANRDGCIDLAATWTAKCESGAEPVFMAGFDRFDTTRPLVEAAEAQCRSGKAPGVALVVVHRRFENTFAFIEPTPATGGEGTSQTLGVGSVRLSPRPESDFFLSELTDEEIDALFAEENPEESQR